MQEVPSKGQAVDWSQHSVDPSYQWKKNVTIFYPTFIKTKSIIYHLTGKATKQKKLTRRNEQGVSLFDRALVTHINLVSKEHFILVRRRTPPLKKSQVGRRGGN